MGPIEVRCISVKQFLPRGPTADGDGFRERDLVQFFSDYGLRTVALGDIKVS